MLRNVSQITGFAIRARDGEIGTLEHFYFDDESWAIRYLAANTGDWLNGRFVLVRPSHCVRRNGNPSASMLR